jgi:hypothetical protein
MPHLISFSNLILKSLVPQQHHTPVSSVITFRVCPSIPYATKYMQRSRREDIQTPHHLQGDLRVPQFRIHHLSLRRYRSHHPRRQHVSGTEQVFGSSINIQSTYHLAERMHHSHQRNALPLSLGCPLYRISPRPSLPAYGHQKHPRVYNCRALRNVNLFRRPFIPYFIDFISHAIS